MTVKVYEKITIDPDRLTLHVVEVGEFVHIFRVNQETENIVKFQTIPTRNLKSFIEEFRQEWAKDHTELPVTSV